MRLVPIADANLAEIARLVNAAFSRYEIMRGDRTSAEGLADECGPDAEFILVERGSTLVGTAMICPAATMYAGDPGHWQGMDGSGALYFGLAGVEPREMNSGIGRVLVGEAERLARERGYERVVLGTVREFGLVEYYARLGYITFAERSFEPGHWGIAVQHQYHDMVKAL